MMESKAEMEGGQGPTTPGGGAGGTLGALAYGVEPLSTSDTVRPPISFVRRKTLEESVFFLEEVP
jgi:hypothetical protein